MLGMPAFIRPKRERAFTDEDLVAIAKESTDGDDDPPLPAELLRRLAEAAEGAFRSYEVRSVDLDPEEVASVKSQILTVVAFLEAFLERVTRQSCRVNIQVQAGAEARLSIRTKTPEPRI